MAFFSIIVPVYKTEKYLEQCVRSVLNQTFTDYELILVDDGSPDKCPQICDEYAEQYTFVHVIHKENGGLSDARNTGLDNANGEFVMFLDSDDFWDDNDCLKKVHAVQQKEQSDVLIFGMRKYYQNVDFYGKEIVPQVSCDYDNADFVKELMKSNGFMACACDKVIRRTLIGERGLAFRVGQLSEDIEWCANLLVTRPRISVISESFYVYRQQNAISISSNISRKNLEHISDVIERYIKTGEETENEDILNFMAVQYVLWLTISNLVPKKEIKDLIERMKKYWPIVKYDAYPYVKIVRKVYFLGFRTCRWLLAIYKKVKTK